MFIQRQREAEPTEEVELLFLRDLRELSYGTEDRVDRFMFRRERKLGLKPLGFEGYIDRPINLLTRAKIRHRMAADIRDIRSRVKEIAGRFHSHGQSCTGRIVSTPNAVVVDPCLVALYGHLVGLDGPRNELIKLLLMEEEELESAAQVKVISIVRSGGLGKTEDDPC